MKKLLNFIVCLTAILALSSCDAFNSNEQSQEANNNVTTVEGVSQEIKDKIAAQDTLMSALALEVDTLAQALTQTQKENAELKAQVTKLESPKSTWGYMTFAALAMAIIALILSFLKKGISREDVDKIFSHNLDKSQRVEKLKENVVLLNTFARKMEARLREVESTLSRSKSSDVHNMQSAVTKHQEQPCQSSKVEFPKKGYAKINSGDCFTQIFDSAEEGCVFSIEFKSATKGEFNIIAVDKIKSRNYWQEIVEYNGLSIKDATNFKVEEFGICEKDKDVWRITKKLKIKLFK